MKGAKTFFTLLFFSIAAALTGGCSSPIGGLLADSGADYIKAVPNRFVYSSDQYDPFIPAKHVEVFGVFRGKEKPIAIEDVEITVSEYPLPTEKDIVLEPSEKKEGKQLDSGVKNITISYSGKEAQYHIEVREGVKGDDDEEGPTITIIWEW